MSKLIFFAAILSLGVSTTDPVKRPVDPWVFYGAVDGEAGRIVVALHEHLWLAYDTVHCALYRAWKGSAFVNSSNDSNAVKDQVIIQGFDFLEKPDLSQQWEVSRGGRVVPHQMDFSGYQIKDQRLTLTYELVLEDGTRIQVSEQPEYGNKIKEPKEKKEKEASKPKKKPKKQVRPSPAAPKVIEGNRITLDRTFSLGPIPDGVSVRLQCEVESLYKSGDIKADGKFVSANKSKRMFDWGNLYDFEGKLVLNATKPTSLSTTFTINAEVEANKNN